MNPEQEQMLLDALKALRAGDFSVQIPGDQPGTAGEIAETLNGLVQTIQQFNTEATRLFREIGGEGRFGGQAEIPGVHGAWYNLTLNMNAMAANLTCQVRDLSRTLEAATLGQPVRPLSFPVAGEMERVFRHATTLTAGPKNIK